MKLANPLPIKDGGKYYCYYCGKKVQFNEFEINNDGRKVYICHATSCNNAYIDEEKNKSNQPEK